MDASIGDPRLVPSVERAFDDSVSEPGFWRQLTPRAMVVSTLLAVLCCFITQRIFMTAGIVPSLNMPTTILIFFVLKWFVSLIKRWGGVDTLPFTRQENSFVLTVVNNSVNVALISSYATCTVGMSSTVAKTLGESPDPQDVIDNLHTGKFMLFLVLVSIPALLTVVPFMEVMLIDYRLLFPSGTVSALLINSFHTPEGPYVVKLQIATLFKTFLASLSWTAFQWFYTAGGNCGFQSFPTFGLHLYKQRFYFDFSALFVGLGMICPYIVNITMLFGGTITWCVLYPYIESKQGEWYLEKSPTSLSGSNGYKVFLSVTIILTDGVFNFLQLASTSMFDLYNKRKENAESGSTHYFIKYPSLTYDDRKRIEKIISNRIPLSLPVLGYILFAIISGIVIPSIFHQIKFYHVAALYTIAPVFAFSNTYGVGLTDWSAATTYAKFTIFVIAAWIHHPGAVVASLLACGIISAATQISSQAMQDFKTGYMTLTSPRVMLTGQVFGIILGAVINPCIFYVFRESVKKGSPIGAPTSKFPCPYAGVYRAIGIIGVGGVKELPKHCLTLCAVAFCLTLAIDILRLISQRKGWSIQNYAPNMTALALPFFIGPYIPIPMCVGSIILYLWKKVDAQREALLSSVIAAGLISGEGLFTVPTSLLTMLNVQPPICMKFLPSGKELGLIDSFLSITASSNS